ncbi:MAG: sigma-70 family RNA polymerase sigma factor [Planctomycetes bacterium]|nr:sigma-70 family RNA polymerase sigma factor [Planctomycetota bacterium]
MSDDSTIARAIGGDATALNSLIERVHPQVTRLVHEELQRSFRRHHRWILPLFSTNDFVQDVMVSVLRGLSTFTGDEPALAKYLATAVSHRLIDAVRHHEAARRVDHRRDELGDDLELGDIGPHDEQTPFLRASLSEQLEVFRAALETMTPIDRQLIDLRLVQELEFDAIAARLEFASGNSARKAFGRAHARLAVKLRAAGLRPPGATEHDFTAGPE